MHASRTGFEPVKSYQVASSATWAQPAISGRHIFVKDINTLALWTIDLIGSREAGVGES